MSDRVNPVIFVDFPTSDPEAMSQFYADLFGWDFKRRPAGEFHEILPGLKPNRGMHRSDEPMNGPDPRVYVMVADPPALPRKAESRGATVTGEKRLWEEFAGNPAPFRASWGRRVGPWRDKCR